MATKVTRYLASDGSEWVDAAQAHERDQLIGDVAAAMTPLGHLPRGNGFANGGGYIQHDPETVLAVKASLITVSAGPLAWWFKSQREEHGKTDFMDAHPSWFGRMLDGAYGPLERAWSRMCCIDAEGREWGQPYYAAHPTEAEQVQIVVQ